MNALSLFSNVGFGEVYLKTLGVNVVVANELEENRCELYKDLHPDSKIVCGDVCDPEVKSNIYDSIPDSLNGIDLIIATPPCQGMSAANALKNKSIHRYNDPRNKLIIHALEVFNDLLPDYMLIENVPGMATTFIDTGSEVMNIIDYINSQLPSDYKMNYKILDSKDYNTPQSRKRFIGLISKGGDWKHPEPNTNTISTRDAIGHLPSLESGLNSALPWHYAKKHNENHVIWMKNTPTGQTAFNNKIHYPKKDGRRIKGFMTTYKRIEWDKPSPTVTMCNGAISSQNNVHPGKLLADGTYSDARVMSVRELIILCGLPENYLDNLEGKYSESFIRKVLGECFPPKMCLEMVRNINK